MLRRISKLVLAIVCCVSLTACGSRVSNTGAYDGVYGTPSNGSSFDMAATASNKTSGIGGFFDSLSSSDKASSQVVSAPEYDNSDKGETDVEVDGSNSQGGTEIQKDMLVYKGDVDITTKEYEKSISGLNELFKTYDCFIEYSREYTNYRYSDETSLMAYEATIRVNSKDYEAFMSGVSDLGVVSSKSSNVKNMNMEYSDTVTALRIQQARLDRYLERLETEYDNEIALQLENQIANIQIELSQLEARKTLIETDVAYSYVDINIREVKAYSAQVTHSDPLYKRVWAEIVNTYYEFTEFLVDLLFFCIHVFPYAVILAIVWFIFRKKLKGKIHLPKLRRRKHKSGNDENKPDAQSGDIDH